MDDDTPGTPHAPFRVGLIGYGLAGSVFHAPLIAATDGLVLDTVVTGDPERQGQARAEHPRVRTVGTAAALLDRPDELDLVVIASPNRTHVPLARAALEAGLPVVVDKPLAATAAEAESCLLYTMCIRDRTGAGTTTSAPSPSWSPTAPSATSSASSPASSAGGRARRAAGASPATPRRSAASSTTWAATSSTRPSLSSARPSPSTPSPTCGGRAPRPTTTRSSPSATPAASAPTCG